MCGDDGDRIPHSLQLFDGKKSNVAFLVTPLLLLPLHLPLPPAPVKANMLETSMEHRPRLEARLRIAGVRALVGLQEGEFNACHQAGWVHYSAAWQYR